MEKDVFIQLRYGQTQGTVLLRGGQLCSFRGADGREVIWQADPTVWAQHAPVLFPVCGAVPEDGISMQGTAYPMKKHGFTRNAAFTVAHQGEDFVDLVLTPTAESRSMYPFDFAFHVTYSLFANGFTTTFLVENRSQQTMPFCVGGHPAFICPMEGGASFEDYQLVFSQRENGRNALTNASGLIDGWETLAGLQDGRVLPLKHQYFDERDALMFTELNSRSVELVHRETGRGLRCDFPKMEVLAVWSKPQMHAGYVCLEPWHGMPSRTDESGRMEDKAFVTLLEPGRCYKTWYTVTLLP